MRTEVIMTGALLMLAILLFARAMMAAWPQVVAEMPKPGSTESLRLRS